MNITEYRVVREIGKGGFGKVYEVIEKASYKRFAMKKTILLDAN